jgi:hypothetical protein
VKNYYRMIQKHEEYEYERNLAELAKKVISRQLGLPDIELNFIAPAAFGEYSFDAPILGFCGRGGSAVFIRRGLDDRDLVLTVAHEVRHAYQSRTGKYLIDTETRERDARIFELETNPPATGPEIRRWLWLEEMFAQEPSLKESFALAEEIMARRQVPERMIKTQLGIEHRHRIANSIEERVDQIRRLLSRLPQTAEFNWQRATLNRELSELLEGIAA